MRHHRPNDSILDITAIERRIDQGLPSNLRNSASTKPQVRAKLSPRRRKRNGKSNRSQLLRVFDNCFNRIFYRLKNFVVDFATKVFYVVFKVPAKVFYVVFEIT